MELLAEFPFDIVMTDVMMPGMSGLEFTRWIKSGYDNLKNYKINRLEWRNTDFKKQPFNG